MNNAASQIKFQTSLPQFKVIKGNRLSLAEKQKLVAQFGTQSSAYFNLQSGVEHFGIADIGFIAYHPQKTPMGLVNMVFANPVCAPENLATLIASYLNSVKGKTMFMGVDEVVRKVLADLGYSSNEMGTEFSFDITSFDVKGKTKKHLRHSSNLGERCGLTVKEQRWEDVDHDAVRAISEQWRSNKVVKQRELRLLTRPPEFDNAWGVRKFYCYQGDTLLGYVFFDPYFENGKVVGYCANILRRVSDAGPSDLLDFVILEALKVFKAEGIKRLSLGISPLYNVESCEGENATLRRLEQFMYKHCNMIYAFQSLAYHKTRYRADETKWYVCAKDMSSIKVALAVLLGTNLVGFGKDNAPSEEIREAGSLRFDTAQPTMLF
ncbi:MAG: DUF2156 domain-containing protein [Hahellaceae bacterium]|nr:DUF2156 domain-containing protein [Hahellaceae bacterium]